ncbi:MAG: LamG-like jellyroll fold domain-containing protein, partial [Candidatus Hodarchaeales archaeon]
GSFSFWIRREFLDSELLDQYVLQSKNGGENRIFFRFDGGGVDWRFQHEGSDVQKAIQPGAENIPKSEWIYIVQSWDVGLDFLEGYINGSLFSSTSGLGTPVTGSYTVSIASNGGSSDFFLGGIDEIRISDLARTEGWITTEFNNQDDPNSFYSIGKEYPMSGIPPNEHYFKYYKEIVIDHTMVSGMHDLNNFPLLFSTFDEELRTKVQADGDDIAFSFKGAWLDHEIELFNQTYNSTHAQLITWISIPRLSTSWNTIIRMYYGNSSMSSRENPNGVWRKSYKGVWHLSESAGSALDSTSHSTAGSVSGTVTRDPSGKIDGTYNFGNNGQINFGNPPDGHLDIGLGSFTVSFWLKIDDTTGNYQIPLYKGATTDSEIGYDFETGMDAAALSFRISDGTSVVSTPNIDIDFESWIYLVGVVDRSSNLLFLFENGQPIGSGTSITGVGNLNNNIPLKAPYSIYELDGSLDEIRISNIAHSADWIATEYSNQYNPLSFLTIGSEESFDTTPPTYSNLMESSDPLELGNIEVITINVSDPSGINQVQIEFEDSNHSMTNIGGDTWQYDSWVPTSADNYNYTIWMEDNYHNWNSTSGTIEVIDTTAPTYSDLIESADPLQLGQNETITIKVYDSPGSGVSHALLEYDSSNHTMVFIGGNIWSWSKWKPTSPGAHPYKIYMNDTENNWNMTSGTIMVVSTTAPVLENHTKSDPLELGNNVTITIDADDNETTVDVVLIELEGVNYTMSNIGGFTYEYNNRTRSYVGIVYYTIYANDTENNWNSLTGSFDIIDTTPPVLENPIESEDPLELGNTVIISLNSTDLADINQVLIESDGLDNESMINIGGNVWQYDLWIPPDTGNYSYTIWAEDNNNNWGSVSDSILVRDRTLPMYSDLNESAKVIELGDTLIISINCTDLAGIKDVSIECENSNNTMTNTGGDIWQYNSWFPNSIGNYTYKIFITDNNDNVNLISSTVLFQDTIIPVYANMFENADPLELGDNQIIRIEIFDIAGINQTLIEFEGTNHSMINIYGNTWQYDAWVPNEWILYQYRIHMEDLSGNWNCFVANITVQDTIAPSPPVLTNSPSGDESGTLVFDWVDGFDPSGISHYILIIDNET